MFLSKKTKSKKDIKDFEADGLSFQHISCFNYLSVNVYNTNFIHMEIKLRLKSAKKVYFTIISLLKSRLLFRNIKKNLYTTS